MRMEEGGEGVIGPLAGLDVAGNTCRLLRQFSGDNPGFLFQYSIPTL